MAYEITVVTGLAVSVGGASDEMPTKRLQFDITGDQMIHHVIATSDTETALDIGGLSATGLGWLHLKNLSSTAGEYIDFGTTGALVFRLGPGEEQVLKLIPTVALVWDAAAGKTPLLEYFLTEA